MANVSNVASTVGGLALYTGKTTDAATTDTTIDYMELLIAQLKAQDPTNAMDSTEMMSQFAQLTTVQELQNLTDKIEELTSANSVSFASSLIGKKVTANYGSRMIDGVVESVDIEDGNYMLTIGDYQVSVSDLVQISANEEEGLDVRRLDPDESGSTCPIRSISFWKPGAESGFRNLRRQLCRYLGAKTTFLQPCAETPRKPEYQSF